MSLKTYLTGALSLLVASALLGQLRPAATSPVSQPLFSPLVAKAAARDIGRELQQYALLSVDPEVLARQRTAAPASWELTVPATAVNSHPLHLRLRPRTLVGPDFRLRRGSTEAEVFRPDLGRHYAGEVIGEPGSRVALSLLPGGELTATISRPGGERLAIGRVRSDDVGKLETQHYALFPDHQLLARQGLDCATPDPDLPLAPELLTRPAGKSATGGCVDVYLEVDHGLYLDFGGVERAAAHLLANFNEVTTLYAEIDVHLAVSELLVWDEPSPYFSSTSGGMLQQFQRYRRDFRGDVAQLVSYQASGGIAILDGLCHPQTAARMSFSSIRPEFRAVPVYSWSTMVIAHELGHQLGSPHTHACVWNGNATAIDGCAGFTEGNCGTPGTPAGGGTIMSYCHVTSAGIDFARGFGPQPGALIAGRVAATRDCRAANCAPPEQDGGNPSGEDEPAADPVACAEERVLLELTLDDFGTETSWVLRGEADGAVYASGGPYPKKRAGHRLTDTLCLPASCYVLEVSDADGDGLCCDYGAGSYRLSTTDGAVLAQGGRFDSLAVTDFCLPLVPPPPPGDGTDCEAIRFSDANVLSFGGRQDGGLATFGEEGRRITLSANAWKAIAYPYRVTAATRLSFWFRADREGEMHGIGLDDNQEISAGLTFRLFGRQEWGIGDYADYPGDGEWRRYSIPVGQHYTGRAKFLVVAVDEDRGSGASNGEFWNVRLTEGEACEPASALPPAAAPPPLLQLLPNPARDWLTLRAPAGGEYRILDGGGRTILKGTAGESTTRIAVGGLPAGTYLLHYRAEATSTTRRFTVVR